MSIFPKQISAGLDLECQQVVLIESCSAGGRVAKDLNQALRLGEELSLNEDELAFYDALEVSDSGVQISGDECLRKIARELVENVRKNASIDWTERENVQAKLRVIVKRILKKYGYRKSCSDRAKRPLEDQLNDMMPALVELAAIIRKERLERERTNAAIDEEYRQRDLEQARRQRMESDLKSWRFAVDLRALISQVRSQATVEEQGSPVVTRWLQWADWVASGNDPLNKGVASFVERYKF